MLLMKQIEEVVDLDIQGNRDFQSEIISREKIEERETVELSKYACKSIDSKGRLVPEEKDYIRTEFQRDRDRIVHSKAFRRLMHKTQVFLAPEGDHYRTRLTHTIEVSQIARTIARGLGLNEDLTEAIALGHDLGHTPFGHNGERVLNKIHKGGFKHNKQSLRVVDVLESRNNGYPGLNLTMEVRDGIVNHTGPVSPFTLEGQIVKISDRIAYINHDIDDAIRSGVLNKGDIPKECLDVLGYSHSERINFLVIDMIRNSLCKDEIKQSKKAESAMNELRAFMFQNVYLSEDVKSTEAVEKVENIVESLYQFFLCNSNLLPEYLVKLKDEPVEVLVKDYVAGMTDRYAISMYKEILDKRLIPWDFKLL